MRRKTSSFSFIVLLSLTVCIDVWGAPFAYITNSGGNTVSVIDTATNTVVGAPIPVGTFPGGVAVDAAGTRVYVANSNGNNVSVIDPGSNTVVGTPIPVGTKPVGVAVNRAGTRVYVANAGSDTVSLIDTATNTVIGTIPVGTNPLGVAIDPAGTRVYVANAGSDTVSAINTASNTVIGAPIPVGNNPIGVAIDSAGTRVYVANANDGNVSVIDTATNMVIGTITVGTSPWGVAVNPAGTQVYVANEGSNSVSVIDTGTNTVIGAPILVGTTPVGVVVNPDGTRVYVANYGSNNVSVIDTGTNTVIGAPIPVGTNPYALGQFIVPPVCRQCIRELIAHFYNAILGRDPDPGGAAMWASEIERIVSLGIDVREGFQALAKFFFNSDEYYLQNKTDGQFVTDLYQTFLNRAPDPDGFDFWVNYLGQGLTRNMLITQFAYSDEFKLYIEGIFGAGTTRPEDNLINDLYRGFLNRFPDSAGFNGWVALMRNAQCTGAQAVKDLSSQIALGFVQSQEYALRNRSNQGYVEDLYNGILRRGADPGGFVDWVTQLNSGTYTREQMLLLFTNSAEFQFRVQDIINAGCMP